MAWKTGDLFYFGRIQFLLKWDWPGTLMLLQLEANQNKI